MEILYKPRAVKQLKKLTASERGKILRKVTQLSTDPYLGKKLIGELTGLRSVRVWPLRLVYAIEGNSIIVYSIAHRQSVYKKF